MSFGSHSWAISLTFGGRICFLTLVVTYKGPSDSDHFPDPGSARPWGSIGFLCFP